MDDNRLIDGIKTICRCKGIKKKAFLEHISAGLKTVAELQEITGAGSGSCKGKQCTPRIENLLQSGLPANH